MDLGIDIGLPAPNELEITTIGPGAKNGESIVVHLGDGVWFVIDSCKAFGEVLPLSYLSSIGVDFACVKKVICTHWHTDHIRGIDTILQECQNATLDISHIGDYNSALGQILKLAGIDIVNTTIWKRFDRCLAALASNGREVMRWGHDATIFTSEDESVKVHSLGPSEVMVDRFYKSLLQIDPNNPSVQDIETMEANLCSMAIAIRFHGVKVLLGGDMETGRINKYDASLCKDGNCSEHENCGWCNVKEHSTLYPVDKPFTMIKLPHHSSVSAFCPKMWPSDFTETMPVSTSTLFNCAKGESLPTKDMLKIYHEMSKEYYLTSDDQKAFKQKERDDVKEIEENSDITLLKMPVEGFGIVVCRWRPDTQEWVIRKFGRALQVDEDFISTYHTTD